MDKSVKSRKSLLRYVSKSSHHLGAFDEVGTSMSSSGSNRIGRARATVESLGVKLHRFEPSGRTIWTVVGRQCDFLVDFDPQYQRRFYCACNDFYFRVLSTKVPECYHILACKIASEEQMYEVINFSDEEFPSFLKAVVAENFKCISFQRDAKAELQP